MAPTCPCRTTALRTFVRSVAQVHLPNDSLARAAPWHEARRQLHRARTTAWPAVSALPFGSTRTAATHSGAAAVEMDEGQTAAAADTHPGTSHDEANGSQDAVAEDGTSLDVTSPTMSVNDMLVREAAAEAAKAEARPEPLKPRRGRPRKTPVLEPLAEDAEIAAATTRLDANQDPSTKPRRGRPRKAPKYEELAEDPEVEVVSVEEMEAAQLEQKLHKERVRAERKIAREKAKKEEDEQQQIAKRRRDKERAQNRPAWAIQKEALKEKFPEGWRPRRKLSPDALNGIRALNQQFPDTYTTEVLANKFEVSPEAIRRILKSRWEATVEEEEDRQRRWHNRGVTIWEHYAAIGKKPPVKWREAGVGVKPARGRGREWEQAGGQRGWYDEEMESYGGPNSTQVSRIKRQQKLAKQLL